MIIYSKHYYQLCNRLFAFVPVFSYALEKKERMIVFFSRYDYLQLFPNLKKTRYITFLWHHFIRDRIYRGLNWFFWLIGKEIDKDVRYYDKTSSISVIDGWNHRSDIAFIAEHKDEIRKAFDFSEEVKKSVKSVLTHFDGVTVGVHIRRGDYNGFCGGKYYFGDEVYVDKMMQIKKALLAMGKECRFLISTNGVFDPKDADLKILKNESGLFIDDLCALSMCDMIIGPPSTFSQWASFINDVPLLPLLERDQKISLDDFSKIVRLNHFHNGNTLMFDSASESFSIE